MRYLRKWIRNVFGFSGTEINGFLILIPLLLVLVLSEPLYEHWVRGQPRHYSGDFRKLDSLASLWENSVAAEKEAAHPVVTAFFDFDPNTATVPDLRRLGFTGILANRIAAYRRKGGVFRVKSDLLKIYGVDSALYDRVYGYISLPAQRLTARKPGLEQKKNFFPETPGKRNTGPARPHFDLNIADTAALKRIFGIGSTLAARIVKFREGLGGFVSPQQLFEVYGLDSLVVKRLLESSFIESDFEPRQININIADEHGLSRHPYIDARLARVLVAYRFQHGDFRAVSDIKKLPVLNAEEIDRLLPYLKVKD